MGVLLRVAYSPLQLQGQAGRSILPKSFIEQGLQWAVVWGPRGTRSGDELVCDRTPPLCNQAQLIDTHRLHTCHTPVPVVSTYVKSSTRSLPQ